MYYFYESFILEGRYEYEENGIKNSRYAYKPTQIM
jgi:hypothetical protein